MSEKIITGEEQPKAEWRIVLCFEMDKKGNTRAHIHPVSEDVSPNEMLFCTGLRKLELCVNEYLARQEIKNIQEATRIVTAAVPQSVADRLRT